MRAEATLTRVRRSGVIGIVRADSAALARQRAHAALDAGLDVVEVSLTTPGALEVIAELAAHSTAVVGAGTVLTSDDARRVIDHGATIIVTPALDLGVIEVARAQDVAVFPGCLTPSEMFRATQAGATGVKIFPAHLWSPRALAGLLEALPQLRCVPTGGVTPDDVPAWLSAGAVAVGMGAALTNSPDPAAVLARIHGAVASGGRS